MSQRLSALPPLASSPLFRYHPSRNRARVTLYAGDAVVASFRV